MNLLSACIKIEGCSGGVLSHFLPFVKTHLTRLGKIYNSDDPSIWTWENRIRVYYKDCIIAEVTTLKSLADFDLMNIPENAWV